MRRARNRAARRAERTAAAPRRGRARSGSARVATAAAALAAAAVLAVPSPAAAAAPPACARLSVPAPPPAPASDAAIGAYLAAVDRASDRVTTGVMGRSVQGRPIPYAVVSAPRNLARLPAIAARARQTRATAVDRIAPGDPAIVWLAAAVHANEPSGADADLEVLRSLAAGERCDELRDLIVVIVPVQNPDGRVAHTRTNANGFDLNRDWFAATQPETRAKLALLRRLPPIAFADQHEQSGRRFFFPPDADPIHHEVPAQALHAIDDVFGPALRAAFTSAGLPFETRTTYDLFFMGYGDTVPTTLFGAAGMTFEQGADEPYARRVAAHALAARTLLDAAARHRAALQRAWAASWRAAQAQGVRGELQPNRVIDPGDTVRFPVPPGRVHAYLVRADVHAADAAALVRRLQADGVRVQALPRATSLPAFHAYGAPSAAPATLPAGTYVVPLAQPAKHWVEALLGQDADVPFPYFYDVSSWSNPLLMGLAGGWSARPVAAAPLPAPAPARVPVGGWVGTGFAGDSTGGQALALALLGRGVAVQRAPCTGAFQAAAVPGALAAAHGVRLHPAGAPPCATVPLRAPHVALLTGLTAADGAEESSAAWMRFVLRDRLGLRVQAVTPADVAAGRLGGATALIVPDGAASAGALPPTALHAVQAFVAAGGTYVGVRTLGIRVARAAGLTTAAIRAVPGLEVPGATFGVAVDPVDPVAWGEGARGFAFDAGDPVVIAPAQDVVVRHPVGGGLVSGYARGAAALGGTAVVTDAPVGAGRVVLFATDPAFRAYVEGEERLLANALLAPAAQARAAAAPRPVTPLPAVPAPAPVGKRPS